MTLLYENPSNSAPHWIPSAGAGSFGPAHRAAPIGRHRRPLGRRIFSESGLVFLAAFAVYFTVAMLLDFRYHAFDGDAISRMANGFYILHSRDPHLAAVGFVWNPLSSIADLPLLAFNSVWPALASHNVAGTTMSALAMGGAVYQLHAILREWKIAVPQRLILTLLFAVNPMVLLFGGNGMSEALYLFTMLAATRYLLRWLRTHSLASLVYAALALAFAYLERSEPVAAAAFAAPLVFWVTYARSDDDRRSRTWAGLTDVTILLMPIITAFAGGAVTSWVITGQPFEQFTSKYGNSALIAASHEIKGTMSTRLLHEVKAITYMSPLFALIVIVAVVVAARRRNIEILGVAAIIGGGLAFTLASYLDNSIFPWFRYYILMAPLGVLLVGSILAAPSRLRPAKTPEMPPGGAPTTTGGHKGLASAVAGLFTAAMVLVLLVPSVPGTAIGMDNRAMAPDILLYDGFIFHRHLDAQDIHAKESYSAVRTIADYLNAQHLSNGQVVVDTADNCIPNVVTNVDNPRMFVIHNDRDFQRTLDDPLTFHAHYLLVQGSGSAQTDAVGQQYPSLGRGAKWAMLVHSFSPKGLCVGFDLYKVTGHTTGNF